MPNLKKKPKPVKKTAVKKVVKRTVKRAVKKRIVSKSKPSVRAIINNLIQTVNALIVRVAALENPEDAD